MLELYTYIIENVDDGKYSENSQWLACKCPYCDGESNKRHFNIQLKEDKPLIYKCFRASCGVTGVLNKKVARDLGLVNLAFLKLIEQSFNKNIKLDATKNIILSKLKGIILGDIDKDVMDYFKKRTGVELTEALQEKFRISSSASQFLENNRHIKGLHIANLEKMIYREKRYKERYLYFFNDRFTMIYGRQINGDRKIKMSLVNKTDGLERHMPYAFNSDGDLAYKDNSTPTLFLGEGFFDIVNAYLHVYKKYKGVFMASTSFEATGSCINLYTKYEYKPNIVILSDSEIDVSIYTKHILRYLTKFRICNIYVVYNMNGEDMGDYKGNYKLSTIEIWRS